MIQFSLTGCSSKPMPTLSPLHSPLPTSSPLPTPSPTSLHRTPVFQFGWTCSSQINCVYDLMFDQEGNLWAAGGGGIARWDFSDGKYTRTLYTTDQGLASGDIRDATRASDGSLWFSGLGISHYQNETWSSYDISKGLPWRNIGAIAAAPDGTLWLGGWEYAGSAGIAQLVDGQWTVYTLCSNLCVSQFPYALALAPDGALWIGTYGEGAFRFISGDNGTYTITHELNDNSIWDIAVGSDETLWFGTYDNGIYNFDGETWSHYTEEDGLDSERITSISVAPDGKVWFATGKGVAQFSNQTFTSFIIPDRVPEGHPYKNNVTAVTIAPDGILWVATADGIFQFVP